MHKSIIHKEKYPNESLESFIAAVKKAWENRIMNSPEFMESYNEWLDKLNEEEKDESTCQS